MPTAPTVPILAYKWLNFPWPPSPNHNRFLPTRQIRDAKERELKKDCFDAKRKPHIFAFSGGIDEDFSPLQFVRGEERGEKGKKTEGLTDA
ncbi:hypothetical protein CHARACLAT_013256 [Characodon lateralis]|uniref:Uncharacterized protein n=1 Tax=Characodon lateralis TaxID=208331 RepID=A0ABU7CXC2_9TELE|nr:hypothetical protein [Characodon lateralis]